MITLAIIIALSFVLLFGASVRGRIKRDRDGGLLDVSCNHCGKWISQSTVCSLRLKKRKGDSNPKGTACRQTTQSTPAR